jgi:hypothetical protein
MTIYSISSSVLRDVSPQKFYKHLLLLSTELHVWTITPSLIRPPQKKINKLLVKTILEFLDITRRPVRSSQTFKLFVMLLTLPTDLSLLDPTENYF